MAPKRFTYSAEMFYHRQSCWMDGRRRSHRSRSRSQIISDDRQSRRILASNWFSVRGHRALDGSRKSSLALSLITGSYVMLLALKHIVVGPSHGSPDYRSPPTTRPLPHRGLQSRSIGISCSLGEYFDSRQHCQGSPVYGILVSEQGSYWAESWRCHCGLFCSTYGYEG